MSKFSNAILSKRMKLANTTKIGLSWCVIVIAGVYAFYLSKSSIEQKRYDHMKIRERIKQSNIGEYEPSSRKYAK